MCVCVRKRKTGGEKLKGLFVCVCSQVWGRGLFNQFTTTVELNKRGWRRRANAFI